MLYSLSTFSDILQLFKQHVAAAPYAIAVDNNGDTLSYQELFDEVNNFSGFLLEKNLRKGDVLAIAISDRLSYLIAVLAAMNVGVAFMPVDLDLPEKRIFQLLAIVQPDKLLVVDSILDNIESSFSDEFFIFCNEYLENKITYTTVCSYKVDIKPDDLAYVICTSGTTGEPKAVEITHVSLSNVVNASAQVMSLSKNSRWLSATSFMFDISYLELFLPITIGATVVFTCYSLLDFPEKFIESINALAVTIFQATPSVWQVLTNSGSKLPEGITVLCGGENISQDLANKLADYSEGFWYLYGPTEATIWSSIKFLTKDEPISIGAPIAYTEMLVVNQVGELISDGEIGEIVISGIGLAKGYRHDNERTQQSFVQLNYENQTVRAYKTGDLACYLPNGEIKFIGRKDNQVKIHGYRVDLHEIENVLESASCVKQAVVLLSKTENQGTILLAYVVLARPGISADFLREYIENYLPRYMVPSIFLFRENFPLTLSGKIDRKLLENAVALDNDLMPNPRKEEALSVEILSIWQKVLGNHVKKVSDNFFAVGGTSIDAIQICLGIYNQLDYEISASEVFRYPSAERLADKLLSVGMSTNNIDTAIPSDKVYDYKLTQMQQEIVYAIRARGNSSAYSIPVIFKLSSNLNVAILERAIINTIKSAPSLSMFIDIDNSKVSGNDVLNDSNSSISIMTACVNGVEVTQVLDEFFESKFSLSDPPFLRALIVQLQGDGYYLAFKFHHIVSDDWTISLILNRIAAAYNVVISNVGAIDHVFGNYYVTFNNYLKKYNQSKNYSDDISFWKKYLSELKRHSTSFPAYLKNDGVVNRGANASVTICSDLVLQLQAIGIKFNTTIFTVMLSVLHILLYRYFGNSFIIGVPVSLRDKPEFENLIGLMVSTLPTGVWIDGKSSCSEILASVNDILIAIIGHSFLSFDKIREIFNDENQTVANMFATTFTYQDSYTENFQLFDVESDEILLHTNENFYDMSFFAKMLPSGAINLSVKAHRGINNNFLHRLLNNYKCCIENILEQPSQLVKDVQLLSESEKVLLNHEQDSGNTSDFPSMIELFSEIVRKYKDNIAIKTDTSSITYAQLDELSDKLAQVLRIKQLSNEAVVGFSLPASIELIAGYLAVLKLGLAYTYIDVKYPKERVESIIKSADIQLLVSHQVGQFTEFDIEIIDIDSLLADSSKVTETAHYEQVLPENLAYVIYTSGTTGQPKGVMVEHRSISSLVIDKSHFNLSPQDVVAQASSLAFDASVFEIWSALLNGAVLRILNKDILLSAADLTDFIVSERVSLLFLTPALLARLSNSDMAVFSGLKTLIVGGDKLSTSIVSHVLNQSMGKLAVINGYGPSEAACFTTFMRLSHDVETGGTYPIGKPLLGRSIHILDKNARVLPAGVIGEVYISGSGVSRGYVGFPELTDKAFEEVLFPFQPYCIQRCYKTGDLGRIDEQGNLEFYGRVDDQVKKSGYRIELSEITNKLLSLKGVSDVAAITVKDDNALVCRISVFVVPADSSVIFSDNSFVGELESELKNSLPYYMLPDDIILLSDIPLNSSGKYDVVELNRILYKTLSDRAPITMKSDFGSIEEKLKNIWCQVLHKNTINLDDNFFDVGGDSLTAITVCEQISDLFSVSCKITDIFTYTTISELSGKVKSYLGYECGSITDNSQNPRAIDMSSSFDDTDIAIIGVAGKFSGCEDLEEYWNSIINGKNCVTEFESSDLKRFQVNPDWLSLPEYRPIAGFLENVFGFDAEFFNYSKRSAKLLDPHHRVFMQIVWKALESAGYIADHYQGKIGLFCGMSDSTYPASDLLKGMPTFSKDYNDILFYSNKSFLATHIAYKLGLKGPAINYDTACSTSLVAVAQACDSLLLNNADIAVAGGISLIMPDKIGYLFEREHIFSNKGFCSPFDIEADGIVPGVGAGVVVCKKLSKAYEDGDNILAIIKGYAVNNDAADKVGYAAPGIPGQQKCITEALTMANVDFTKIRYIETHGTGTRIGDIVEVAALKNVFASFGVATGNSCSLGSVKANIGHANYASGIAGLIKLVLMIQARVMPPQLHFNQANPGLDLEHSPFYVNNKAENFGEMRFWGGVSSFGIGGTNAHVVLTEPDYQDRTSQMPDNIENHFFLLSAKTKEALVIYKNNFIDFLEGMSYELRCDYSYFCNLIYTMQTGRQHFQYRYALPCNSCDDLLLKMKPENICDNNKVDLPEIIFNWLQGKEIDIAKLNPLIGKDSRLKRIPLPVYPFQASKHLLTDMYDNNVRQSARNGNLNIGEKLKNEWCRLLDQDDIDLNENLYNLGLDSLTAIDWIGFVEKEYGTRLQLDILLTHSSIQSQIELLTKEINNSRKSILVELRNVGSTALPIFFIHPIGGSLFCFMPLISKLNISNPIYGFQDPLITGSYKKFSSIEELAALYIDTLKQVQPEGPYIFAGYSAGGTLAYEMSQQLSSTGVNNVSVIMFDTWANLPDDIVSEEGFQEIIERQLDRLKLGLFSDYQEHKELWYQVLWNRLELLSEYKPSSLPESIKMTIFRATELCDEYLSLDQYNQDGANGWRDFVSNVEVHDVNCGHEVLFLDENIILFYAAFSKCVESYIFELNK